MTRQAVTIKGVGNGLLIRLGPGDLDILFHELANRLKRTASFFHGGEVTLAVGSREMTADELQDIRELFSEWDVGLKAISSSAPSTRSAAEALGLEVDAKVPEPQKVTPTKAHEESEEGLLIRRTLRSGQAVRHRGHLVVIGDVNAGAEIMAGGDVVVWGRLRGLVHAGAMGDDRAVVCALALVPTQLRIGNHIARAPDQSPISARKPAGPEIARVQEQQIVVEPWDYSLTNSSPRT